MDSIVYRVKVGPVMEKESGVWGGELKNWVRVARKIMRFSSNVSLTS